MISNKLSGAGKGSKPRPYNINNYENNYESIEWRRKGTYCYDCGKSFNKNDIIEYYSDGHAHCVKCNFN